MSCCMLNQLLCIAQKWRHIRNTSNAQNKAGWNETGAWTIALLGRHMTRFKRTDYLHNHICIPPENASVFCTFWQCKTSRDGIFFTAVFTTHMPVHSLLCDCIDLLHVLKCGVSLLRKTFVQNALWVALSKLAYFSKHRNFKVWSNLQCVGKQLTFLYDMAGSQYSSVNLDHTPQNQTMATCHKWLGISLHTNQRLMFTKMCRMIKGKSNRMQDSECKVQNQD